MFFFQQIPSNITKIFKILESFRVKQPYCWGWTDSFFYFYNDSFFICLKSNSKKLKLWVSTVIVKINIVHLIFDQSFKESWQRNHRAPCGPTKARSEVDLIWTGRGCAAMICYNLLKTDPINHWMKQQNSDNINKQQTRWHLHLNF